MGRPYNVVTKCEDVTLVTICYRAFCYGFYETWSSGLFDLIRQTVSHASKDVVIITKHNTFAAETGRLYVPTSSA